MKYNRGRCGPVSISKAKVAHFRIDGTTSNPLVKGVLDVELKSGRRMVSFMAQGRHAQDFLAANENCSEKEVTVQLSMRWTARESVTIIGVHKDAA